MDSFLAEHETAVRLGCFLGVFAVMALWELVAPRRVLAQAKGLRWSNNLGIVVLDTVLLRLLFPAAAVGMAVFAEAHGWGLLNYFTVADAAAVVIAMLALDLAIYLQHVLFHAVPVLWRLHRVHHADLDFDVSTGLRFHPLEIILSMLIKFAAVAVLGPPVVAVLVFEVMLNATSMFNHSNVRMPLGLDRALRLLIVTPDMHRVHHSVQDYETNSNFGFNFSMWDRLWGTYQAQPSAGHQAMTIGITTFRDPRRCLRLSSMLALPFVGKVADYAINRRSWGG